MKKVILFFALIAIASIELKAKATFDSILEDGYPHKEEVQVGFGTLKLLDAIQAKRWAYQEVRKAGKLEISVNILPSKKDYLSPKTQFHFRAYEMVDMGMMKVKGDLKGHLIIQSFQDYRRSGGNNKIYRMRWKKRPNYYSFWGF